jgi:DoxX-like family
MNILLWIVQIILSIKLLTASFTHGLRQSKPTMQEAMQKLGKVSRPLHLIIAVVMFIGTIGLLLPGIMTLPTWITPLSAVIMAIMLLLSIIFHIKSREKPNIFVSVILFIFAAFIAYGRWVLAPM